MHGGEFWKGHQQSLPVAEILHFSVQTPHDAFQLFHLSLQQILLPLELSAQDLGKKRERCTCMIPVVESLTSIHRRQAKVKGSPKAADMGTSNDDQACHIKLCSYPHPTTLYSLHSLAPQTVFNFLQA